MDWTTTMERHGWKASSYGTEPFSPLDSLVMQFRKEGRPIAKVSMSLGGSEEYGAVKASCTVTLECPQGESAINLAGEVAFLKAKELLNDAATHIGMQQLP